MEVLKNFIVFEGLDGAGTSTQSKLLSQNIKDSILTCEPSSGEIGKLIRKILKKEFTVKPSTLATLFTADRNEHLYNDDGVVANCNSGKTVICDRYLFSTFAYQGLELDKKEIYELNKNFFLPEVLFFINTPIEVCDKRIGQRGLEKEIYEEKSLQEKILSNYLESFKLFQNQGMHFVELDGSLTINELLDIELKFLKEK